MNKNNSNPIIKTIYTNRGYAIVKKHFSSELIEKTKKELMMTPFAPDDYMAKPQPFPIYLESSQKLYLPKFYGFKTFGEPDQVKISKGFDIDVNCTATPRDYQSKVIDMYLDSCRDGPFNKYSRGGLLSVFCGWGKTMAAIYIVSKLKKKTLVIVHKEFLLNQWISEIKRFLPDATIGTIQGQKIDTKGKDIVIGMLQSISMKDYEPELFEEFGLTIIDECHHIAAEVFSRALPKINSYYMLGLSATPNRADGLSKVFHHYLGPFIYKIMTRNDEQKVRVHTIYYSDNHPDYSREELTAFNKVCVPKMVTNIVNCGNRNLLINCLIKRLVADGRKILVLSDRRDHLSCIYSMAYQYATVGYYMGGMKQKELDISAEKQVILGTYPMSSEGLNIPDLDTAIFTTSKSSIEQSIGRIVRKVHQRQPYAFDIVDDFSVFPRQYYKREKVYKKFQYELYETHIDTNEKTNANSFEYQLDHGFKQKRYGKGAIEEDNDCSSASEAEEETDSKTIVKPKKKQNKKVAQIECCIEDD